MAATTRDQIVDIAADTLGCAPAELADDTSLSALGVDNLDCLEIVMRIEDECAVTITDGEASVIATFGDLVALVERKRVAA